MTIDQFVKKYHLRSADVVVTKKVGWEVFDHTLVYVGVDSYTGEHLFAANMKNGIRLLRSWELEQLMSKFKPLRINRFAGNDAQREQAFNRAVAKIGQPGYNILFQNCQHYSSYVQTGKATSSQSRSFFGFAALALIVAAVASSE